MWLSGDRNLLTNNVAVGPGLVVINTAITNNPVTWSGQMHRQQGNICLSDGSVQQVNSAGLQQLMQKSGTNTIRLAIP
jgi:hypothetical protein